MPWFSRIRNLLRRSQVNHDIEDELRFHLEERVEELIQRGLPPEEAQREARLRFGSPLAAREAALEVKLPVRLESILRDARFGLRLMLKTPLFTAAVVFSLALAIGANTAVFSLLDAVVLRPLPVREPSRLVFLTFPGDGSTPLAHDVDYFSYPLFRDLRNAGRPVVDLFGMAYQAPREVAFDGDPERTEKLYAQWTSGDALPLLGVQAAAGRTLTAGDDQTPGAHPVAVISYSLWARRFGRDPKALGRRLRMTDSLEVYFLAVAPGYLETMGIALRDGRDLTEHDLDETVPKPAIVNRAFVKRYFDGIPPVGRRFDKVEGAGATETLNIIGVVADAKYGSVREPSPPTVCLPFPGGDWGTLLVRSNLEPTALVPLLRHELPRVHPAFRLAEIHSQARLVSDSFAEDRALALLSAVLATVAATLAGLGLYAVLSYGVARRTKEIGIRLALGATRSGVVALVLRDAAIVGGAGVAAGLVLGAGLSRFVTSLLFETHPSDAANLAAPVICLVMVTMLSSAPAALRVVQIAPAESLRHE